jgi:hypothetical protein
MKTAGNLSHGELVDLVSLVQRELFLEQDEEGNESWRFSKMHDHRDLLQHLVHYLDLFGLAPA